MTSKELAEYVIAKLLDAGFIVHRYDAYSTHSIYIKLDYGVGNSIRISDHRGKSHLTYRFNLLSYIDKKETIINKNYPMYNYPFEAVDEMLQDVIAQKEIKQKRYTEHNYQRYVKRNKKEIAENPPKGFWQQAKQVKG